MEQKVEESWQVVQPANEASSTKEEMAQRTRSERGAARKRKEG